MILFFLYFGVTKISLSMFNAKKELYQKIYSIKVSPFKIKAFRQMKGKKTAKKFRKLLLQLLLLYNRFLKK